MNRAMNQNTIATLHSLAEAVVDLVDGLDGGQWESDRAEQIAAVLSQIADGRPHQPIAAHSLAYKDWQRGEDECEQADREAERQCIAAAFAAWMTRPLQQSTTTPPQKARRVWGTGRR